MLPDGYRTNVAGLNEVEIQALFVAKPPRLLADLGLHTASEAALVKLLGTTTEHQGASLRGGAALEEVEALTTNLPFLECLASSEMPLLNV